MNIALAWHVLVEDTLYGCWGVFGGPKTQEEDWCPQWGISSSALGNAYEALLGNEEILHVLEERAKEVGQQVINLMERLFNQAEDYQNGRSQPCDDFKKELREGVRSLREAAYPQFMVSYYG